MPKPNFNFSAFYQKWPAPIVARTETKAFTGGVYCEKTMANYDSQGAGPEGRFKIRGKVVYPVDSFIRWLEARASRYDE